MQIPYTTYQSELVGPLTLTADETGSYLTGCWFERDRFRDERFAHELIRSVEAPVFDLACDWLDQYFAGACPDPRALPLQLQGTAFRRSIWQLLLTIPYGQTMTYGEIARELMSLSGTPGKKMSAQAVGGAVGHNPIGIIIPCHRVVGARGSLTGFSGGIDVKIALLEHEGVDLTKFSYT